jgi:hypothetical protein
VDWDEDEDEDEDEVNYTIEDINFLCEEEDDTMLLTIIDNDKLIDRVLQTDDPCDLLGFEWVDENTESYDTPDKYRERLGGGYEYKIYIRRN